MKSLEIINERINKLKGKPELVYYDGHKINCLFHNGEGAGLLTYSQLEIIQQSLEVLEIIRKKKVDVNDVYICDRYELYALYMKNLEIAEELILTLEEFSKIKQWLEENKR